MKNILLLTGLFFVAVFGYTQQLTLNSLYLFNETIINPAAAGSKEYIPIHTSFRRQWAGLADAPTMQTVTAHGYAGKRMGIGGVLYNDVAGPSRRSGIQINTSYHLRLDKEDKNRLGMGLSMSLSQNTIDVNKINTYLPDDPAVARGFNNQMVPDLNAGLYYYNTNKAFFGISAHNLVESRKDLYRFDEIVYNPLVRTYYVAGGYTFNIGNNFKFRAMALGQAIETLNYQVDATGLLIIKDLMWLGASYRHQDAIVFLGGIQLGALKVGYAYDFTRSELMNHATGSHEVFVEIQIFPKNSQTIDVPWLKRNRIYSPKI